MDIIKIKKAIGLLQAQFQHLPQDDIEEIYVKEFHANLSSVQGELQISFAEFQISDQLLKYRETGYTPEISYLEQEEETHYSESRYCPRDFFLIKITGAINFLNSLTTEPEKKKPGFT